MAVEMIFNELSLRNPFENKYVAREKMAIFIQVLRAATKGGFERKLLTKEDFDCLPLASEYAIYQWRTDREVDREEQRFLRILQNRNFTPLVPIADLSVETNYAGQTSIGLEHAYVSDGLSVSFQSEDCWDTEFLALNLTTIDDDDLTERLVHIHHASCQQHIQTHLSWIEERLRTDIASGSELVAKLGDLFPNLDFCQSAIEQLRNLQRGNVMLQPITKQLFELENYCKNWQSGAFSPDRLPRRATTESNPTLNQYGTERTFSCPDGENRLFSWHIRLTPLDWRLYFIPTEPTDLNTSGRMTIGYIGEHLPTIRFN